MRDLIQSIAGEYQRYRKLAEDSLAQVSDDELNRVPTDGNSIATLVRHLAGNLRSRFTDFLTTDGEKPWRDRETEFTGAFGSRAEMLAAWGEGWKALEGALVSLTDDDAGKTVTIRGQQLSVREALHRSLSHTSYHVGQIVLLARSFRGDQWRFLSIPPGKSAAYNRMPSMEKRPHRVATLQEDIAVRIEKAFSGPVWHGPALAVLLSDVTPAEAVARPVPGAHTIAEIVRHCIFWCDDAVAWARTSAGIDPAQAQDWPAEERLDGTSWRALAEELATSHRSLAAVTRGLSLGQLAAPTQGHDHTLEDQIRGVIEHGAYHGGQIALLLRALRGPKKA